VGQRLGLSDPSSPCYKNFAHRLANEAVFMDVENSSEYKLRVESLKEYNFDVLQISSPANPPGNVYKSNELKELIEYAKSKGITFISDELYHGLVYEDDYTTALKYDDEAIVINGFSKYYCLPGARLGWIVVPKRKVREAEIVAQNLFISAPTISQFGAMEAFDDEYLDKVKETFRKRRDFLYEELKSIFNIEFKPNGAFYIWADVSKYSNDSFLFAKELLNECHVGITPGVDFGKNNTHKYLRFAYTREISHLKEGVSRIREYLKNR
jgi:aspartate/methionine/tyrosine aminotransferase